MHTHLVEYPVSKTQQLPEEVEPAVQEGEETQQKEHYTWDTETEEGWVGRWPLLLSAIALS